MDHFQIPNMPKIPLKLHQILEQLAAMSKQEEINFAFAFTYPDQNGRQWFEVHTGGDSDTLKTVFNHDANAIEAVKLKLAQKNTIKNSMEKIYFHQPPIPLE